jgi:calcineurin-like phosphoesterase family protein
MNKVWWTSDTHWGHANIIRYCNRPFGSVSEMDETMIANWNAVVRPEDEIWHLGDFAHGADAKHVRSVFHRLNGIKRLVIGNHDGGETLALPWADPPAHMAHISIAGVRVYMCHYGLRVWPGMRGKAISLYGHSHGRLPGNARSLDVGADCWGFAPVGIDDIRRRLKTLPEAPDPECDPGDRKDQKK